MEQDTILHEQLAYRPQVVGTPMSPAKILCGGMGGSALPAEVLSRLWSEKPIDVHRDYGLPAQVADGALCVAISFSGNTEETLSFAQEALEKKLPLAIITSGGKLLELARESSIPHVVVPAGMQPRDAVIATTKALAALVGANGVIDELSKFEKIESADAQGAALAEELKDRLPVVYASRRNGILAYITKITLNETAKSPAFYNVFPELNHNEMQGLDPLGDTGKLLSPLGLVLLHDSSDNERVQKRMHVFEDLMRERKANISSIEIPSLSPAQQTIWVWRMARTAAHQLAAHYGAVADEVPLVEEFKKRLA